MNRLIRGCLIGGLGLVLVLAVLVVVLGVVTVRRPFPQENGELTLAGLDAPVDVYRDAYGIPHIFASTSHDLFYVQGYVHAQDRFWQMDFWRHTSTGRLSEMFGEATLDTDRFLRTMGWARVAQQELEALDPTGLAILAAYADGVNAYLDDHQGSALSLEHTILGLLNADYQPEPWLPVHSLAWTKAMAWDLGDNMDREIERAQLLKTLSPKQVAEIIPAYPEDGPVIVPGYTESGATVGAPAVVTHLLDPEVSTALSVVGRRAAGLEALLGMTGAEIGSNSWVISGDHTATGMPLLANDPHLPVQMPSIWYEVDLRCTPKGPDCPYQVTGFSFAGMPGVIIGHNDRIAWGFTNVGPDVQDLYIERVNPANPNQYEVNGEWQDMRIIEETIQVAGGDPVPLTVRYTRHGPIISETYGLLEGISEKSNLDIPPSYAIALRWTALEPSSVYTALWKMNSAENWDEFREAVSAFAVPAQNLVYADVDGNIGYQMPGNIPIRSGSDGTVPVPGWTDEYEWSGLIPFEELPYTFNPPQGYIVTANNPVTGSDYPYMISKNFAYGYRARQILQMIEERPDPISIQDIQTMQGDSRNLNAEQLVPVLMQVELEDDDLEAVRSLLANWDYQDHMDSSAAALFEVFWRNLLAHTFHDDLPEEYWPDGGGRWYVSVLQLVERPDSAWWDNQMTPEVEDRDDTFRQAFAAAVAELEEEQGSDPERWNWGDLHTVTFRNATLGTSGPAPVQALFNRGPYRTSGGTEIVNATSWKASESYAVRALPSMRMIVDLSNLQNSLSINTLGQSGHAFHPHYNDMVDLWRNIQYHPMLWDPGVIQDQSEEHLRFVP